ncbi:cytidine/deoxycytidylate deaminase family protein [Haloplasma contractile]
MEPCPLCFGAAIMSNIRSIKYAARDGWAGGINLKNDYINRKPIKIEGPFAILEDIQIAIQSVYELTIDGVNIIIESFSKTSPRGVKLGNYLYENAILTKLLNNNVESEEIFNTINQLYMEM